MVSVFNDLVSVCCLWSIVCHYHVIHYQYTGLTDGVVWCPADGYQQGHQCPPPPSVPMFTVYNSNFGTELQKNKT